MIPHTDTLNPALRLPATGLKSALLGLTVAAGLLLAPQQAEALIFSGTLVNTGDNTPGTIDFWTFTQTSAGMTTFDILSWQAFPTYTDTEIWLFSGSATAGNLIDDNDDHSSTGSADGSTSFLDSFLSVNLSAGTYVIAVVTCCADETDITDDFLQNDTTFWSGPPGSEVSGQTTAQYQLTITGDVSLVPEPGSLGLLALGCAGLTGMRRRKA